MAQSAFFFTHGRVSMALKRYSLRVSERTVRQPVGTPDRPVETPDRPVETSSPLAGLLDVGVDEEAVHL